MSGAASGWLCNGVSGPGLCVAEGLPSNYSSFFNHIFGHIDTKFNNTVEDSIRRDRF